MWYWKPLSVSLRLLLVMQCWAACAASSASTASAASIASTPATLSVAPLARTAGAGRRGGALYRITHLGQVSYLFGTIHVGTEAFYPLAPLVSSALAVASKLVVELDTREDGAYQLALAKHGSYAPGDTIANHVSPDTLARLTQALHAVGIPLGSVAQRKPWLLANLLMGLELERSGYERSRGLESFLLATAQRQGTAVAELESADYQLALFDTLDDADGERYLRENLSDLANGTSLKNARTLIDAWNSADAATLDALIRNVTAGGTILSDFTRRTLLGKRNPEMAAHIARIMQENKVTFVGVGLLHLLGANGLPQLFLQRGYRVERMY